MFLEMWTGIGMFGISALLMGLATSLGQKPSLSREKNSPFECGFDPQGVSRLSFSLRFFLIAVIFLVFDVEIVLLLPMLLSFTSDPCVWGLVGVVFLGVLLMGLYFEWHQGALVWAW